MAPIYTRWRFVSVSKVSTNLELDKWRMLNVTAYKGTNSSSISGLAVSSLPWRARPALVASQSHPLVQHWRPCSLILECQIHGIIFPGFQLDHVENPDSQAENPDSGHEFSYLRKIRIYNLTWGPEDWDDATKARATSQEADWPKMRNRDCGWVNRSRGLG